MFDRFAAPHFFVCSLFCGEKYQKEKTFHPPVFVTLKNTNKYQPAALYFFAQLFVAIFHQLNSPLLIFPTKTYS